MTSANCKCSISKGYYNRIINLFNIPKNINNEHLNAATNSSYKVLNALTLISKNYKYFKNLNYTSNKSFSSITSNSKYTNESTIFIYNKYLNIKKKYIEEALSNKTPTIISNKYLDFYQFHSL